MYSFQYGGDLVAYFQRYQVKLESRADARRFSGLSVNDIATLTALNRGGAPADVPLKLKTWVCLTTA